MELTHSQLCTGFHNAEKGAKRQAQVVWGYLEIALYKTPWPGDPRVNIQNAKGKAKPYQIKQVLQAIKKREINNAP